MQTMANCEISTSPKRPFRNFVGERWQASSAVMLDITKRKQAELSRRTIIGAPGAFEICFNRLCLSPGKLQQKLKKITDDVVDIFGADFCRIWVTGSGDLCETGCTHAKGDRGAARLPPPGQMSSGSLRVQDGIRIRTVRFTDACLSVAIRSGV